MGLRLQELQEKNYSDWRFKAKILGKKSWEDLKKVLYYQKLLYMPKLIRTELISQYFNSPLADHFGIEKTQELIIQKYYWNTFQYNI